MKSRPTSRGSALLSFLLGILVASLVAAVVVWKLRGGDSEHVRAGLSGPTVVRQIQRLQRLETVVFGLDKIVAGGQDRLVRATAHSPVVASHRALAARRSGSGTSTWAPSEGGRPNT